MTHQHVGPLGTVTCDAIHAETPLDLVPRSPVREPQGLDVERCHGPLPVCREHVFAVYARCPARSLSGRCLMAHGGHHAHDNGTVTWSTEGMPDPRVAPTFATPERPADEVARP